jgi:flagellar motor switch/type III secretory pathway protein FliN
MPQSDFKDSVIRPFEIGVSGQNQFDAALDSLTQTATLFCRKLRRVIPFLARQRARVLVGEAAGTADDVLAQMAAGPSFLVKLSYSNELWLTLHFDSSAILALVDGLFGPAHSPSEEEDQAAPEPDEEESQLALGDTLTLAQRALLNRLCGDIAAQLHKPIEVQYKSKLVSAELLALKRGEDPEIAADAIGIDCRIEEVPRPWLIRLYMGSTALVELSAQETAASHASDGPTMAEAALRIPVNVVAELGRVTLKLSQVLGLRCGDTLRLPAAANDPVLVRVEGVAKFDAVPVISRGQVAVKIQSRHTE